MARVNWELESGERVEEFVSAMLLLRHDGPGNRITPSRGDRGVDLRLQDPDGFRFFQVKRYTRPLTSAQEREVRKSWATFVRDTVPRELVKSWTLACPLDPSNERLDWLRDLTDDSGIPVNWLDRTALDAMAAEHPALVAYYFTGGEERLHRQLANAFQAGRDVPVGSATEDLLAAITTRLLNLQMALDDVDPFYRYELEIRAGRVQDEHVLQDLRWPSTAALIEFQQLDTSHYQVMRVIPRRPASVHLRPITSNVVLHATTGSPEYVALEEFRQFGVPLTDARGTVVESSGPPGARQPRGDGLFTVMPLPGNAAALPDLEVRLVGADDQVLHAIDLVDIRISRGLGTPAGMWLFGTDRAGAVGFSFLLGGADGSAEVRVEPLSIAGKTPSVVLPAIRMKAAMVDGTQLALAVREGPELTAPWPLDGALPEGGTENLVRLLEALADIQRHTLTRVVVPDVKATPVKELNEVLRVGRLLRGEMIEVTWTKLEMTVTTPERLPPAGTPEVVMLADTPLSLRLNGQLVELNVDRRVFYRAVRLADGAASESVEAGDQVTLLPGADNTAVMLTVPRAMRESSGG